MRIRDRVAGLLNELIGGLEVFNGIEWCVKGLAIGRVGNLMTWMVEDGREFSLEALTKSVIKELTSSPNTVKLLCRVIDVVAARLKVNALSRGSAALLDLCCGGGAVANALTLNPRIKGLVSEGRVIITGLDLSPAMLKAFRDLTSDSNTVTASVELTPFRGDVFDEVTCLNAAHEVGEINLLMHNVSRVLRVGGRLTLIDRFSTPVSWVTSAIDRCFRRATSRRFENPYLINEVLRAMRSSGLTPVKVLRIPAGVREVRAIVMGVKGAPT